MGWLCWVSVSALVFVPVMDVFLVFIYRATIVSIGLTVQWVFYGLCGTVLSTIANRERFKICSIREFILCLILYI